jgi:holliday junction DNA helicase RuvA
MFAYLKGIIAEKNPTNVVMDCNGVGYLVNISLNTFAKIPGEGTFKLYIHFSVKEDAHLLFGFADEEERRMFRNLISVSGVGETTARIMLSSLTPHEVQQAIYSGDVTKLKSVKGIGEKTAQRIIVDLGNKMGKEYYGKDARNVVPGYNKFRQEALNALETLGFAKNVSEKALDKTIRDEGNFASLEELVKKVLKNL